MTCWREVVLLSFVFALHGCFSDLPEAVQLAIAGQCDEKVQQIPEEEGEQNLQIKDCSSVDADRLSELGVDDCSAALTKWLEYTQQSECENVVGGAVEEDCAVIAAKCKESVDSQIESWTPEKVQKTDEEEEESDEETLALFNKCFDGVTEKADALEMKVFEEVCSPDNEENLTTMGVNMADCADTAKANFIDGHTIICVLSTMMHEEAPEDKKDVTAEFLDTATGEYLGNFAKQDDESEMTFDLVGGSQAERLRLFQSVVQGKGWPKKRASASVAKLTILGSVAVGLFATVVIGYRRNRAQEPSMGEEMLVAAE